MNETYRHDDADDDHDDFRNGGNDGIDGASNSRYDSTLHSPGPGSVYGYE